MKLKALTLQQGLGLLPCARLTSKSPLQALDLIEQNRCRLVGGHGHLRSPAV